MDCDCGSVFNRLSKGDKVKLRGSALTKAITGFVRDDTEERPWLYPVYLTYMLTVATPLPFFGAGTVVIAGTAAWAKYGSSERAQDLNQRITESFNEAALVCAHKEVLEKDPDEPDQVRLNNMGLIKHTAKAAANDTWKATKIAFGSLKRLLP